MRPDDVIGLLVNRVVRDRGLVLHPDDPAWRQLEIGFVKAQRRAFEGIKARLNGEDIPTPQAVPAIDCTTITMALRRWSDVRGAWGSQAKRGGRC